MGMKIKNNARVLRPTKLQMKTSSNSACLPTEFLPTTRHHNKPSCDKVCTAYCAPGADEHQRHKKTMIFMCATIDAGTLCMRYEFSKFTAPPFLCAPEN